MTRSKQLISVFLIMLLIFQFSAPMIQIGLSHTPEECEKKREKWEKKKKKVEDLNKEIDEKKKSKTWNIVKEVALDATIGGLLTGGTLKSIDKIAKEGAKHVFKKAFAAGAVISGVWTAIRTYKRLKKEIEDLEAKRDKIQKEADDRKKEYDDCMKHTHASGSLMPYMDSPTYLEYGDTHYALFQANTAYYAVYWYVLYPGQTGYGTLVSTDMGDGSKMSSTLSFTAPNIVGSYTITAHTYFTDTIIEPSYSIYVSSY